MDYLVNDERLEYFLHKLKGELITPLNDDITNLKTSGESIVRLNSNSTYKPVVWTLDDSNLDSQSELLRKSALDFVYSSQLKALKVANLIQSSNLVAESVNIGECEILYDYNNKCLNFNFG